MNSPWAKLVIIALLFTAAFSARAQSTRTAPDPVAQIRAQGLDHSQVMETLSYLTNVIGPRLTGSPNLQRANNWTRDRLTAWGLANAHLEPWGPFGRRWSLKRFSIQVIEPQSIILIACPKAWSPGFDAPIEASVFCVDPKSEADLDQWKGKLHGAIVLAGGTHPVKAHFEAPGIRMTEADMLVYANSNGGNVAPARPPQHKPPTTELLVPAPAQPATRPAARPASRPAGVSPSRLLGFLREQGAAAVLTASPQGDGGTIFVASAGVPGADFRDRNAPKVYSAKAPPGIPQIAVAVEDYNRMVRMLEQGEKLKIALDFRVDFPQREELAYNTIAEIPGTDLKDQIVMLGGHMDSWHSGTGATDNGAGVAVAMEAVRIIQAAHLHPRRTIRIALWTGEEQGLLGSKAYVSEHFGRFPEPPAGKPATRSFAPPPLSTLIKGTEYDRLDAYFNLDNGTGRCRGIFLQGNEPLRPIFRRWMAPLNDLGADTLSLASTGSTDHIAFDSIGLPGFQFIQDPIEYMSRTHHSNQDVFDRAQEDDLKQASVVMATFVYQAAMADDMLPRKIPQTRSVTRP